MFKSQRPSRDFTGWMIFALLTLPNFAGATAQGPCPADVDGNGAVDSLDLNYLLGVWGTADPLADFDQNGEVGCFDLAYLQGNWGDCPGEPLDVDLDGSVTSADEIYLVHHVGLDCQGDLDENGAVDGNDIDALLCLWGEPGPLGDFIADGTVDSLDLNYLLASFGEGCTCDLDGDALVTVSDLEIFRKGIGK